MTSLPPSTALQWRLHADKLMLLRNDEVHTAILGFQMVASWFNHTPPNSLDLEYAIQLVEDTLAPLKPHCIGVDVCVTDDHLFLSLCQRLHAEAYQLTRDQLEQHFDAMCATLNRPMALEKLGMTQQEIAYLLVLREAMHHLDLPSLRHIA